jgi:hypothetical protein
MSFYPFVPQEISVLFELSKIIRRLLRDSN